MKKSLSVTQNMLKCAVKRASNHAIEQTKYK